jgi:DNA invertase Pin-like site-specific DNA recombinase
MVKDGRIPKGSVLVVERLDRLSRIKRQEDVTKAIYPIVRAGVDLATTTPQMVYTADNIDDMATWLPLRIWLDQAAEESRKISERLKDVHGSKRAAAQANQTPYGRRPPAWIRLVGQIIDGKRIVDPGHYEVNEEKAALVRKMFLLAAEGMGVGRIAGVLDQEYPEGLTGRGWQPGTILDILRSRSVLGEYQPHTGTAAKKSRKSTRQPAGDPVMGFYPAVVAEADFYRAQAALDGRRRSGGPKNWTPNMFNGLIFFAPDGKSMQINSSNGRKVLVSSGAIRRKAGSAFRSVPYVLFETALLGRLAELKPADVTGRPGAAEDRVAAASGRLTTASQRLEAANAKAAQAEDPTVFMPLIADLDRQKKAAAKELEEARTAAADRTGDSVGEFTSLVHLLDEVGPDEQPQLRLKIHAALKRVVDQIWVNIARKGRDRLVGVEVWFKAEKNERRVRTYLIHIRQAVKGDPGGWKSASWPDSWPADGQAEPGANLHHLPVLLRTMLDPKGVKVLIEKATKVLGPKALPPEATELLTVGWETWMDQPLNPWPADLPAARRRKR